MSMFRSKKLDLGSFVNIKVIRDHTKRKVFEQNETERSAQLQLSQMHCYTRPTQIKNRCIAGGKGRGVFRDFRMARVRSAGQLPGVKKASW
ncbi:unnamed protein product [Aureobasidium pullulans]|nr:unnamed protein product [Aureobasidium pullulans]